MKNKFYSLLPFLTLLTLFLLLRLPKLGLDMTHSDSPRWHIRSHNFLQAVRTGDFAKTYQHNQPGITLMWLGSIHEFHFHKDIINLSEPFSNYQTYLKVDSGSKVFLVFVLLVVFVSQLVIITRLYGRTASILYALLASTEPFLIGVDRIFHVTSLENYLLFLTFLLLSFFTKEKKLSVLLFASLTFALSLLTKSSGLVLLPLFAFMFFRSDVKSKLKAGLTFLAVTFILYYVFFPALWTNPAQYLTKIFSGIENAVYKDTRSMLYNNFLSLLYYPVLFAFKSSPQVLIVSCLALYQIWQKKLLKERLNLLIYILLFYVSFSLSVKKIDRYLISLLLPLYLVVALYLEKIPFKAQRVYVLLTLLISLIISYLYFPVFSSYYAPYFGGIKMATKLNVYSNSGQYYQHAATYLNNKENLNGVLVPFNKESFHYTFKSKDKLQDRVDKNTDYIVTSANKLVDGSLIPDRCKTIEQSFGSRVEKEIFVFKCVSN